VPELHVQLFLAAAAALVAGFAGEAGGLGGEPGREEAGGVEVGLEVAQDLGGGEVGGFVYCWE